MERIEEDVRRELRRFGSPDGLPELLGAWSESVGQEIERNAWPARLARDGTLHVATSSATWAFELTQLAPQVLDRLRGRLGAQAPKGIRFAPGRLPEPAGEGSGLEPPAPISPRPDELSEASSLAAKIDDVELRESVQRAAALSLARARSGRSVW